MYNPNFFKDIKYLDFPITLSNSINTDFIEFKGILLSDLEPKFTYAMVVTYNCSLLTREGIPFDPVLFSLKNCSEMFNFGLSLDENIQYLINQLENRVKKSDLVLGIYKNLDNNQHN